MSALELLVKNTFNMKSAAQLVEKPVHLPVSAETLHAVISPLAHGEDATDLRDIKQALEELYTLCHDRQAAHHTSDAALLAQRLAFTKGLSSLISSVDDAIKHDTTDVQIEHTALAALQNSAPVLATDAQNYEEHSSYPQHAETIRAVSENIQHAARLAWDMSHASNAPDYGTTHSNLEYVAS